jgi:hypothetical protein
VLLENYENDEELLEQVFMFVIQVSPTVWENYV